MPGRSASSRISGVAALLGIVAVIVAAPLAAHADVVPGSQADLVVTVAGPVSAVGGDAFSYTVTIQNNSLPDADGASFTDVLSPAATGVAATCAGANGATCPASISTTDTVVTGTVGLLPHLGVVTITVTGRFPIGAASLTNTATVTPPAGVTDPDLSSNTSVVSTVLDVNLDVVVTKTSSAPTLTPNSVVTYTVRFSNSGPSPADGTRITDRLDLSNGGFNPPPFAGFLAAFTGCTASGGAICPAFTGSSSLVIFDTPVSSFPAGGALTITYRVTFGSATSTYCAGANVANLAFVTPPEGTVDSTPSDDARNLVLPVDTSACPVVSVSASATSSVSTLTPGSVARYTVTFSNGGPAAADGSPISDTLDLGNSGFNPAPFSAFTATFVACTPSGGAACPAFSNSTAPTLYRTTIPTMPAGSSIVVVYDVAFVGQTADYCQGGSVANQVGIEPPLGSLDSTPNDNFIALRTPVDTTICGTADLRVTETADTASVRPDRPTTYTVTFTNNGPAGADGAAIVDVLRVDNNGFAPAAFTGFTATFVGCAPTGGAACPAFANSTGPFLFNTTATTFPAGASISVTYRIDWGSPTPTFCTGGTILNVVTITAPTGVTDPTPANDEQFLRLPTAPCADLVANTAVSPLSVRFGEPITYSIRITNGGPGAASAVAFTDQLPADFTLSTATCTPVGGSPTCNVTHDPVSNSVVGTVDELADGVGVVVTVSGISGIVPSTYANTATVSTTAFDPNLANNTSQVNLQVFNTTSDVVVTSSLTGFARGLPAALAVTGTVACASQPPQRWTATIAPSSLSGSAPPLTFFDGGACTVTLDPLPPLPTGYRYAGAATITPSVIDPLGPTTTAPVAISVPIGIDPPIARDDSAVTTSGTPVVIHELANDSGIGISPTSVGTTPFGSVTINTDGSLTFTSIPGFVGIATFPYTITDALGATSSAIVTVTVNPAPPAPLPPDTTDGGSQSLAVSGGEPSGAAIVAGMLGLSGAALMLVGRRSSKRE